MAKKLYVGSLSYSTTDEGLTEAFSKAGTVESARVITDRETGRAKGFGFVEMSTDEEAVRAIQMFDRKELDGRTIIVSEARPRTDSREHRVAGRSRARYGGHEGYSRR